MKDFLCLYPYFQWIKLKIGVFFWGARIFIANFNATFPFPQVFSPSPFPLAREPTVTA